MSARPPRVLLIDDDLGQLKQMGDALYAAGWHVQLLQHPTLAIATARSFQPDLVVVDLKMPVLDGREVMRALKSFDDTVRLPVVLLTEGTALKDDVRLLQGGPSTCGASRSIRAVFPGCRRRPARRASARPCPRTSAGASCCSSWPSASSCTARWW